jgi:hypothetical protein
MVKRSKFMGFLGMKPKAEKTADAILTRIYAAGLTFYNGWKRVDDRI